ncbi:MULTISPECIES: 2-oxo-4-hydroxy-4-carboxy-5-ureidoimidazoline decarboxylase [Brevibacterium]|uniref:2-oxo-4-hydroxy-4-carboxy-5-ureidoimidazoline decarboxylase n=2 Tax=Brevibacterium antiquum TaxID=234835 RepID=A0A2H1IW34_9MICO|nr:MULTISPECIES: 2-oxo-4-hydroxy-4-carboxy-5-ureidoimidazoline decarboxylase [Brevibacterium]SMX75394.1 2-oxo-4-hydroxy-4-carboxy-5-ureidoimidazoline decarboxylase [Brevibacterium antiquum]SMX79395.1 2-oxo-4-hydroxy-4-carboxy-5-ureidoimidazoline decarboxylase [Brevibacterium antiquum CNRZ 918]HCG57204.1 2-oxo-4-hydroxy-4-carboxy-5-ureidoimidazoline decarboxylase [Brevibacterium sp.]
MDLSEFNQLPADDARTALRPCLDVDRWIDGVVAARPYSDLAAALDSARTSANPLSPDEIARAMSHHPRIGEKAKGASAEAAHSSREQAGLGSLEGDVQDRLAAGNAAYEERFDRVFLIRAAGRSPEEILAELQRRMSNTDTQELAEVGEQLIQIAALRLEGILA